MIGIASALISTFFASSKDLVSKSLAHKIDGTVSACASFLYALPWYALCMGTLYLLGYNIFNYGETFLWYVFLRSITDTFAELFKMHALKHGDISFIANFLSLAPVFLLFTSPLITGESIHGLGLLGVLLICLATILLVYNPTERAAGIPWKGVMLATASAFFFSLNSCFDRLAVQSGNAIISGFAMTLLSGMFLTPAMLKHKAWQKELKAESKLLHLRGVLETLFMVTKLHAMSFLEAQYVVGIGKIGLVFSIIGGGKVHHEEGYKRRLVFSILIIIGSVLIIFENVR